MTNRFDRLALRYVLEALAGASLFALASYLAQKVLVSITDPLIIAPVFVAAMVPMLFVLWTQMRYFRRVDERDRHIMAVSGAITLQAATFSAMQLEKLDVVWTVDLNLYAAFLLALWPVTTAIIQSRA